MADLLHGQLMYNNTRLVISSTERQYTITDEVHEGLRHDPKDKTMDLRKRFSDTKDLKRIF